MDDAEKEVDSEGEQVRDILKQADEILEKAEREEELNQTDPFNDTND